MKVILKTNDGKVIPKEKMFAYGRRAFPQTVILTGKSDIKLNKRETMQLSRLMSYGTQVEIHLEDPYDYNIIEYLCPVKGYWYTVADVRHEARPIVERIDWDAISDCQKLLLRAGIKATVNRKVYIEFLNELEFERDLEEILINEDERLKALAHKWDITVPEYSVNTRYYDTGAGYAVLRELSVYDSSLNASIKYDARNKDKAEKPLPSTIRKQCGSVSLGRNYTIAEEYEKFFSSIELTEEDKKLFRKLDTEVCPICGQTYNIKVGCTGYDGKEHVKAIQFIGPESRDRLFYGGSKDE